MIRMVSFILGLCWSFLLDDTSLKYHYARLGCPKMPRGARFLYKGLLFRSLTGEDRDDSQHWMGRVPEADRLIGACTCYVFTCPLAMTLRKPEISLGNGNLQQSCPEVEIWHWRHPSVNLSLVLRVWYTCNNVTSSCAWSISQVNFPQMCANLGRSRDDSYICFAWKPHGKPMEMTLASVLNERSSWRVPVCNSMRVAGWFDRFRIKKALVSQDESPMIGLPLISSSCLKKEKTRVFFSVCPHQSPNCYSIPSRFTHRTKQKQLASLRFKRSLPASKKAGG